MTLTGKQSHEDNLDEQLLSSKKRTAELSKCWEYPDLSEKSSASATESSNGEEGKEHFLREQRNSVRSENVNLRPSDEWSPILFPAASQFFVSASKVDGH